MHPPPPPPRRPPRRPLTPLPAPRRLSGAFCERRGHHRRGQLGRPLLCTHCRCRPPRSRRPLPRSVSSSRSTAAPRLSIAVTSATTMTSASAIARPPPPAAWVRHPSAGHPRPSGRLSPLYPCSFDHDQDAHPTPSRDHRPGPGWNRRSVLRSRGRSCRVRLPTRPTSLDPRPTTLPGLTRRAPRSASTGVRAADRLVPVRLHASASGAVFRALEVYPGGYPGHHVGLGELDAAQPLLNGEEQLLLSDGDLDGFVRKVGVPPAVGYGHRGAAGDGAVVAGHDRLGRAEQALLRVVPRGSRAHPARPPGGRSGIASEGLGAHGALCALGAGQPGAGGLSRRGAVR